MVMLIATIVIAAVSVLVNVAILIAAARPL